MGTIYALTGITICLADNQTMTTNMTFCDNFLSINELSGMLVNWYMITLTFENQRRVQFHKALIIK